jgi:hypothetical protein
MGQDLDKVLEVKDRHRIEEIGGTLVTVAEEIIVDLEKTTVQEKLRNGAIFLLQGSNSLTYYC